MSQEKLLASIDHLGQAVQRALGRTREGAEDDLDRVIDSLTAEVQATIQALDREGNTPVGEDPFDHYTGLINTLTADIATLRQTDATAEGRVQGLSDALVSLTGRVGRTDAVLATPLSFRNKLINGGFQVWQRGLSFTANGFTADRWSVNKEGNTTGTFRVEVSQANQPLADYGTKSMLRIRTTAAGNMSYIDLAQKIEGVGVLAGKTMTLSFLHRFGNIPKEISIHVTQNFGVGGSEYRYNLVGVVQGSTDPAFTRSSLTFTLPDVAGKAFGAGDHNDLVLRIGAPDNSDFFDIGDIQLELGDVATPFEQRPYGLELSLCQRYYETGHAHAIGYAATSHYVGGTQTFKVTKRTTPTIRVTGVLEGNTIVGTPFVDFIRSNEFRMYVSTTSSGSAVYSITYAADAEL